MTGKGINTPRPSFVTTTTDAKWKFMPLSERALHVARSQDAVREFPKGSNWGPSVSLYLKAAGILGPAAWCAAFVTWCLLTAGADRKKLPKLAASTFFWWKWAKESDRHSIVPERGSLGVYNGKSGGHIWFCLGGGHTYKTLEGNTNTDGSREGYGVFERERTGVPNAYPRWTFIRVEDDLFEGS